MLAYKRAQYIMPENVNKAWSKPGGSERMPVILDVPASTGLRVRHTCPMGSRMSWNYNQPTTSLC